MGCKVDSLVERHDLTVAEQSHDSMDAYLVARWTGADGRSSEGYKSLTAWFNKRVLQHIYEAEGRETVTVHLEREYELIADGDGIEREELAADLATDGLDIEAVERELISWSTMRHHLKDCLDAEKETASATTDWEVNTVDVAREQAAEKTRSVLSSLTSKGRLPQAEDSEVDVQVKLSCPDCSVRVPFEDALQRGYVCKTHLDESEDNETSVTERVRNHVGAIAIPYGVFEIVQTLFLEDPLLIDAVVAL